MSFKCFFNSHFVFVSQIHISFLQGSSFRFAVIIYLKENLVFAYILTFLHKKCKKLWYYQFILIYLHRFNRVLK